MRHALLPPALLATLTLACNGTVDLGGTDEPDAAGGSPGAGGTSAMGGAGASAGSGGDGGGSAGNPGTNPLDARGELLETNKLDVLFVVDNSASMADKQWLLRAAGPSFLSRIQVEYPGVRSIHVGVISSSLGSTGADSCSNIGAGFNPTQDDRAHLLTRTELGGEVPTYRNRGYLAWDPDLQMSPPGEPNLSVLSDRLQEMILGVGESGCGFEAPLEAWYRFLFDPEPYQQITRAPCFTGDAANGCSEPQGIDGALLAQRQGFLRPDSALAIVMLTDENDCSVAVDAGPNQNFIVLQQQQDTGQLFQMPRSTDPCTANPDDACCHSCAQEPPAGCPATRTYASCNMDNGFYTVGGNEDAINLRCFDQKRRFGIDVLQPVDRYVEALSSYRIRNREGSLVDNPVYEDLAAGRPNARGRELVFLMGIVGVPWQNLARPGSNDPSDLEYMSARELREAGRWDVLVGDPANRVPPSDPLMRESIEPRAGMSFGGGPIAPPTAGPLANPINGHERDISANDDLQYSCIIPLPVPRPGANECQASLQQTLSPLCQNPLTGEYSDVQYFAKAFPSTRQLRVLEGFGDNAIVSSICAASARPSFPDLGYFPAFDALVEQLGQRLAR